MSRGGGEIESKSRIRLRRQSPQIQIAPLDQRGDFAVSDGAFEHPEAAVGMHVAHAVWADSFLRALDGAGDFFRCFNVVDFYVHDTYSQPDALVQRLERVEVLRRAVGQF